MRVYSDLLKKPFDTEDELIAAEKEFNDVHAAEIQKKEERKNASKKVEEAFARLREAEVEAQEGIDAIRAECNERVRNVKEDLSKVRAETEQILADFCAKYGAYHTSIDMSDSQKHLFSSSLDSFWGDFFRFFW